MLVSPPRNLASPLRKLASPPRILASPPRMLASTHRMLASTHRMLASTHVMLGSPISSFGVFGRSVPTVTRAGVDNQKHEIQAFAFGISSGCVDVERRQAQSFGDKVRLSLLPR